MAPRLSPFSRTSAVTKPRQLAPHRGAIQDQTDMHKLSPPWEGPFVVSKNLHNGSYYLIDVRERKDSRKSEEETNRPWNIAHLRPYYT